MFNTQFLKTEEKSVNSIAKKKIDKIWKSHRKKFKWLLISILFLEITSKDTWSNIKYINMPVH